MKAIALSALLIATPALSAESDIQKAAKINYIFVEATIAQKFCPNLIIDQDALFAAMKDIGGDRTPEFLDDFRKTEQAQAYVEHRVEAFKASKAALALECEKARLLVSLKRFLKSR